MVKKIVITILLIVALLTSTFTAYTLKAENKVVAEVIFSRSITDRDIALIQSLGGTIIYRFNEINGVAVFISQDKIDDLEKIKGIKKVGIAAKVEVLDEELPSNCSLHGTVLTWNLDIINVPTVHEEYGLDGSGVYVAVLDTGLEPQWRDYFPEDRIDSEHAAAFLGAMATAYSVTEDVHNRNAWEADTHGHGMHVTSTIIGFKVYDFYTVDGVAPGVTIIPVKVISNAGWGFTTDVAAGIIYIANLYLEEVESGGKVLKPEDQINPIVINLSLGSRSPSPLVRAAIGYAIESGVFVVAAAGNEGREGMVYPAAYPEVISVGAIGWTGEWEPITVEDDEVTFNRTWWRLSDVPEREELEGQVYITDFSSWENKAIDPEQDLDVLAPGSWVVGPYTPYGAAHPPYWANGVPGQYYFLGGTSMATPHVSGIIALLLQKCIENGELNLMQEDVEAILEKSTYKITWYSATVFDPIEETYVTLEWEDAALGNGLVQADLVIQYIINCEGIGQAPNNCKNNK